MEKTPIEVIEIPDPLFLAYLVEISIWTGTAKYPSKKRKTS